MGRKSRFLEVEVIYTGMLDFMANECFRQKRDCISLASAAAVILILEVASSKFILLARSDLGHTRHTRSGD